MTMAIGTLERSFLCEMRRDQFGNLANDVVLALRDGHADRRLIACEKRGHASRCSCHANRAAARRRPFPNRSVAQVRVVRAPALPRLIS